MFKPISFNGSAVCGKFAADTANHFRLTSDKKHVFAANLPQTVLPSKLIGLNILCSTFFAKDKIHGFTANIFRISSHKKTVLFDSASFK